jgi:tRNA uridine 5-carboxymethylaminomethyl modification enzyme
VSCSQVVICTGTFLSGEIHIGTPILSFMSCKILILALGMKRFPAGRLGDSPSTGLSASLKNAGFKLGRLQTGTPARLDGSTIDFIGMQRQDGDSTPVPFSFLNNSVDNAVRVS